MDVLLSIPKMNGSGDIVAGVKIGEELTMQGHSVTYTTLAAEWVAQLNERIESIFPNSAIRVVDPIPRSQVQEGHFAINVIRMGISPSDVYVTEFDDLKYSSAEFTSPTRLHTGLSSKTVAVSCIDGFGDGFEVEGFETLSPMIYRPYGLGSLPNPGEENMRELVISRLLRPTQQQEAAINSVDRMNACYAFFTSQYGGFIREMQFAADWQQQRLGVAVLTDKDTEPKLLEGLKYSNEQCLIITRDGTMLGPSGSKLVVVMLDKQPQTIATRLFWASEMPNLVTGDHSLSDAIYGLTFKGGQGFFYECNGWKHRTSEAISEIVGSRYHPSVNFVGTSSLIGKASSGHPIAQILSSENYCNLHNTHQLESFSKAFGNAAGSNPDSITVQGTISALTSRLGSDPLLLKELRRKRNMKEELMAIS